MAGLLRRRLGWVVCVASAPAPAEPCPASALPSALAGLSPVWKDPDLAAAWNRKGAAVAPSAPVALSPNSAAVRLFGADGRLL